MRTGSIACLVAIVAVSGIRSQAGQEMVTDRPDATESSSVVEPGYVQTEAGWVLSDADGVRTHTAPGTLVRIGAWPGTELRLGWDGYVDADSGAPDGAGDGSLGGKVALFPERGAIPETALLASVSLPWGADGITSDEADPGFRFSMAHTLSETFSLGYNLGAEWATEDDHTLSTFIYTLALGAGLTDAWGVFVELYGDFGMSAPGDAHTLDGGVTYLVRENLQLDALAGVGLDEDADDWMVGAGVSFRLPK